jgi:hypothetical protein
MPRFIVHTLAQAKAALTAAAETGIAITLESPPDAVRSLGADYFLALVAAARSAMPTADNTAVLDCGRAPGSALAALRAGAEAVRLDAKSDVMARVADIAAQLGARVESEPAAAALDLNETPDPLAAARAFIRKDFE